MRRTVITGMGIWCSLGRGLQTFGANLRAGHAGLREVKRLDLSHPFYRSTRAAVLKNEELLHPQVDQTLIADLTLTVSQDALQDASLTVPPRDPARFGVALGTSHGGNIAYMQLIRGRLNRPDGSLDESLALSCTPTVLGQVARWVGARGPTVTISTACASGTNSVGRAAELIQAGRADVMLAGGADLFTELSFSGFNMLGAMTRGTCRPLDRRRDGMVLGDGAAMLVLEEEQQALARGARIYARVMGHAIGNEAFHPTAPRPDGSEAARVMQAALRAADMDADAIDYINLHGTGTEANDEMELRAVAKVFGARAPAVLLSSTKSLHGHTLGAAGSVEIVATVVGMTQGFAPPGINLEEPMADFSSWSYVRDQGQPARIRAALSNSFGFSGNLASIVLAQGD